MSGCHQVDVEVGAGGGVALVGNPNVGKSVLFQRLTGRYATVSNYAGTTVQVTRGAAHFLPDTPVIDTPGIVAYPARLRVTSGARDPGRAARRTLKPRIPATRPARTSTHPPPSCSILDARTGTGSISARARR